MDPPSTEIVYPETDLTGYQPAHIKLLPEKSKDLYFKDYKKFEDWRVASDMNGCDENVVFAYLSELSKTYKSSSLWCMYSKLKKMVKLKEGVDISGFPSVAELMKNNSVVADDAKNFVLQRDQIEEFISKAPDNIYLLVKVVTMFGMFGSCRRSELHDIRIQDVTIEGSVLVVNIRQRKTYAAWQFTIESNDSIDYMALFHKYKALRPPNIKTDNLFVYYNNGKCTSQPVGKNTFGKMPRMIANFLNLPDADKYTGHCFARIAAAISAESGVDAKNYKLDGRKLNYTDFAGPSSINLPQISGVYSSDEATSAKKRKMSPRKKILEPTIVRETDPLEITEANKSTEQICRTCLDRMPSDTCKSIFTDNIPSIISMISDIELIEGDGLPSNICDKCFHQLQAIMEFKTQIESSDFSLRKRSIIENIEQVIIKEEYEDSIQIKEEDIDLEEFQCEPVNLVELEEQAELGNERIKEEAADDLDNYARLNEEIEFIELGTNAYEDDTEASRVISPSTSANNCDGEQIDHEQQEKQDVAILQREEKRKIAAAAYMRKYRARKRQSAKRMRLDSENAISRYRANPTDPIPIKRQVIDPIVLNRKRALAAQRSRNYRNRLKAATSTIQPKTNDDQS